MTTRFHKIVTDIVVSSTLIPTGASGNRTNVSIGEHKTELILSDSIILLLVPPL